MKDRVKDLIKIHIDNLTPFQDNLKGIDSKTKEKLMNSIIRQDYCAPIVVWQCDADNQNYILDGHQRFLALMEMQKRGIKFDFNVSCVLVDCKNHDDARKKLLTLASSYGYTSKDGFLDFIQEHSINTNEIDFNFPDINLDQDIDSEEKQDNIILKVHLNSHEEYEELYTELAGRGLKLK